MGKRIGILMVFLLLAWLDAGAKEKDAAPLYKTAEAKHFTQVEGVELTPAFGDYFYAELRAELKKSKMAADVIGEGEAVDDADAAQSIVVVGTITEYKKGNVVTSSLIGFGVGARSLKMDADVQRRSDKKNLCTMHIHVKIEPRWDEKTMAKFAAQQVVKDMKKDLKPQAQ